MEAMASGCAVVVYDGAGSGLLVTSGEFEELRELNFGSHVLLPPGGRADRAPDRPVRRGRRDTRAGPDAREGDFERRLDQLLALYAAVLAAPRPAPDPGALAAAASRYLQSLLPRIKGEECFRELARLRSEPGLRLQVALSDLPVAGRLLRAIGRRVLDAAAPVRLSAWRDLVVCPGCGKKFNPTFVRCPFCNTPSRPGAAPVAPPAPLRRDYAAIAEQAVAANRPLLALEYHPAAVAALDAFFDLTWGQEGKAPGDDGWQPTAGQVNVIVSFGVFLGELVRREFGGAWRQDPAHPDNLAAARVVLGGGTEVFTIARVFRRLRDGGAESFEPLHAQVRTRLAAAATAAEIPGWLRQAQHFEGAGRPDLALRFYERALALGPAPPPARRSSGRSPQRGRARAARTKTPRRPERTSHRRTATPRPPCPRPSARRSPPRRPRRSRSRLSAAAIAMLLDQIARCEDLGQAVEADAFVNRTYPDVAEAWRERGVGLTMLGRGEEALPCFYWGGGAGAGRAGELRPQGGDPDASRAAGGGRADPRRRARRPPSGHAARPPRRVPRHARAPRRGHASRRRCALTRATRRPGRSRATWRSASGAPPTLLPRCGATWL